MGGPYVRPEPFPQEKEREMADLALVLTGVVFFALSFALIRWLDLV